MRWLRGLIGAGVFIIIFSVIPVGASAASWGVGQPDVFKVQPFAFSPDPGCPTYSMVIAIDGAGEHRACLYAGRYGIFATYFVAGVGHRAAYALRGSPFKPVLGLCGEWRSCLYDGAQDRLYVRQYLSQLQRSLLVVDNFSERAVGVSGGFSVPTDNAKVLAYPSGKAIAVGAVAASDNGEWVVVEIEGLGILLVSPDTLTARRITSYGPAYGIGQDPVVELAVSSDGKTVAMVGERAGFRVISVDESCGESIGEVIGPRLSNSSHDCYDAPVSPRRFAPHFLFASRPQFVAMGAQLNVFVASPGDGSRIVSLRPSGSSNAGMSYLALGDSFASGEGETDRTKYLAGADEAAGGCHISTRSYPFLVQWASRTEGLAMRSIACSGARLGDINGRALYRGQTGRFTTVGKSAIEVDLARTDALSGFIAGRIPQRTFVQYYQPEAATIGIGGNDAGFADKLKVCAMPSTCEWAIDPLLRARSAFEIGALYHDLRATFARLRADSALTQWVVVGYPRFILTDESCAGLVGVMFDAQERRYIDASIIYLNQVLRAAAESAGAYYQDIEDVYGGAALCGDGPLLAMNGLRLGDDIAPIAALPVLRVFGAESFHPTPYGHKLVAERLSAQDLSKPAGTAAHTGAPTAAPYWGLSVVNQSNAVIQRSEPFTVDMTSSGELSLRSEPGVFIPNTSLTIVAGNTRQTARSHDDGSVTVDISLPDTLEPGYHKVEVTGEERGGRLLAAYSTFYFEGARVDHVSSVEVDSSLGTASAFPARTTQPRQTETSSSSVLGAVERSPDNRAKIESNKVASIELIAAVSLVAGVILVLVFVFFVRDRGG